MVDTSVLIILLRTVVAVGIVIYCFTVFKKRRLFVNIINELPGPKIPFPLLGNLIQIGVFNSAKKHVHLQTILMLHRRGLCQLFSKEKLFRLWFGPYPFVYFFTPEYAKILLRSNTQINKSDPYNFMESWLGTSTFLHTGDSWRAQRHNLTPAFHFKILQDFVPIVNTNCAILMKTLRNMCDREWIDVLPVITMCTLDIFSESSFGVSIKSKEETKKQYISDLRRVLANVALRTNLPWKTPNFLFNITKSAKLHEESVSSMHEFTRQIIKERRDILSDKMENPTVENFSKEDDTEDDNNVYLMGKKKRLHSLDLLIDLVNNNKIPEKQLKNDIDNLLLAGHDTTRSSIAMTLYLIGSHPKVQEKIVEELQTVFGNDKERPITFDDLNRLKYIECVVKESLRLFPTVPIIGRKLSEDVCIDGYRIPKGTNCNILLQEVHRDPKEFPNPDVFEPDRFLPENCAKRHPYAYIPFSAGARNCLGMRFALIEDRMFVSTILRHFHLRSLDPIDKLHVVPEVVLFVDQPIRIKFTPR